MADTPNGAKGKAPEKKAEPAPAKSVGEDGLTPAEKKKRAKEEKQARRAAEKAGAGPSAAPVTNGMTASDGAVQPAVESSSQAAQMQQPAQTSRGQPQRQPEQAPAATPTQHRRNPSAATQPPPPRRRLSQSVLPPASKPSRPSKPKESKDVPLFSHLYAAHPRPTLLTTPKDIHPAIQALGFQYSTYAICGSTARTAAMLLAFKAAIADYTTPTGTSLARHMTTHFLSPQIEFLKACRPISEGMGNGIRFLKKAVVEIDPSVDEGEAKAYLQDSIDMFLRERIVVTDRAIATAAVKQIKQGAVVLTYAKSSLVEKTLIEAHEAGTQFRVICVDSRPLYEGKNLARTLGRRGIEVEYTPLSGIAHAMKDATLVLLGARSMLSNGRLVSRVGTASIALHASHADVPVIVLCESVKFTGKVALDSVVLNEIAPPEELLLPEASPTTMDGDEEGAKVKTLADWRDIPGLQILNLMYDVTPAEYIRMVICEYGSLPPSSVPVVHRLANEGV
ncbi:hypothetical protein B0A48_16585 [Cryoendolithus antarcticus]|uniref:Translation initiation factor eIF2B subunit delta n=1 Tax=Cryoendolithus antarcticus TaxID=1507870 RepID=A0A1V8SE45_9PEZI|nr:hypothetical protein B0A48_16585 [Cryoendolithus antarcticus]